MSHWIWLPTDRYPELQTCSICGHSIAKPIPYAVVELERLYTFERAVKEVRVRVCGDTYYRLYLNGEAMGDGPVCAGGDFLCVHKPPAYFAQPLTVPVSGTSLHWRALVQLGPTALCDYSVGQGGFWLEGEVRFADGTAAPLGTGSDWRCRPVTAYTAAGVYDARRPETAWCPAEERENIWHPEDSRIPPMEEYPVLPQGERTVTVAPGETRTVEVPFDRIYAAFVSLTVRGRAHITADWYELPELWREGDTDILITDGDCDYRSLRFHSIGALRLTVRNEDVVPVSVKPSLIATHYPVTEEGICHTSDEALNAVYEVCKWTLRICRQTIHLDSPRHQEPLACTGDYYVESLMTACTFGDLRLAEYDVYRTAQWLQQNDGEMFHTSYSLQWVMMLWDMFRLTGHRPLPEECRPALDKLLARFEGYIGENGLLEHCPNYMFVDWNTVDGYTLHHPPKYLGQTCLCMQYYGALHAAAALYDQLNDASAAQHCRQLAERLRTAIRKHLYDSERGLYFDGLPTPDAVPTYQYLPENRPLRHFSKHSNVLAALYGVSEGEEARRILRDVLEDTTLPDMQPYFMHFTLNAVRRLGLQEKYLLPLLNRWKPLAAHCSKGLQEGWFPPDGNGDYLFDFSHAWGGTPAYQLPVSLLGLEVVEPGWRTIRLDPQLYGLAYADISVPTPYGFIRCHMEQDSAPELTVPSRIRVLNAVVPAVCTG